MKTKFSFLMIGLLLCACNKPIQTGSESTSNESSPQSSASQPLSSTPSSSSEESSASNPVSETSSVNSPSISISTSTSDPIVPGDRAKNVLNYLGSDQDIYRINITTEDQAFPVDKENYISGSLNISEQDKTKVIFNESTMKVKLRGNSTMQADKKPFKIKFEKKQSLFGLPKAKNWVLLANYYDKSNVRNYLAYLTANKLNHLNYQPSSIFVDVYFNNDYQGLYLLCEQMEMKEGRVELDTHFSSDGISSFLIEADERAKDEYSGYQGTCYVTSGGYDFALKDPDPDDYIEALDLINTGSDAEKEEAQKTIASFIKNTQWLQTFMDNTSEAIYSKTNYADWIDVDSFIDYYLVEEFFKNVDVGSTSQYYYIDQNAEKVKLTAGPVWDFDIAAGVVDETSSDVYTAYANADLFVKQRDYFYASLLADPQFEQLVKNRYTQVRDLVFESVFDELDLALTTLDKALKRNAEKWPLTQERKTWLEQFALSEKYYSLTTFEQHYDLVESFLQKRLEVLDAAYLNQ